MTVLLLSVKAWAANLVCLALLVLLAGTNPATAQAKNNYTMGAGDEVRVTVFGHEDLSGKFQVDGSGVISLPLIGNIAVGGITVRDAEAVIANKLKPDYLKNPRVNVEVLNYRPFYIIGEVKKPGSYPFVNGMTVINAVALGGGYTYRARENNIFITRAKDQSKVKQKATHDTLVLPGDVIEVPERFF
jgi:protein involved in polysaccharide export with SLBB domain